MNLYREELLDIYKNPTHMGTLDSASVVVDQKNPACGDSMTLMLQIEDTKVKDAKFSGEMCMVSQVSADLVLDKIIGKSILDATSVTKKEVVDIFGDDLTTSRIKCAELVLEALSKANEVYAKN